VSPAHAFGAEADIDAPVEQVWALLTDWSRTQEWMRSVDYVRAEGPTQVGAALVFHARGQERPARIVECVPQQLLTLRSVQGGVTADYRYVVRPMPDGTTRALLLADCATEGMWWTLVAPAFRAAMRRSDSGQLDELKRVVERSPG